MIIALAAASRFLHVSVATAGMGLLFPIYALPVLSLAFVTWAVASRRLSELSRRASMAAVILLACGAWTLVRTEGVTGEMRSVFHWRWTKSPEERLMESARDEPMVRASAPSVPTRPQEETPAKAAPETVTSPPEPAAEKVPDQPVSAHPGDKSSVPTAGAAATETTAIWPGFRGPERNSSVRGVRIATDWSATPPVELWRRPIGPGWSSFAVGGDLFYTQEQRGEDEVVACYRLATGEPVWRHRDTARFWESNAGAGPRATPTLSDGRVFTFGATGIVNALRAGDGVPVWSRNAAADTDTQVPTWGFAGSPLIIGDLVVVAAAGRLVAYDRDTGVQRWVGPPHGESYSSPHLATVDGVAQILLMTSAGPISVAPTDGSLLWEYPWKTDAAIVQPALIAGGEVLFGAGQLDGVRRLAITRRPDGWTVEERWRSTALKPYFNDFVVHNGHAYGFDGSILACVDLADGARRWKGGRYGRGQLVLLPAQNALLVLSEEGELALVQATPDQFTELARFPAIEGKTWNHPVLVGDVLLVRNGEQMAAFRLALDNR
jgi:outer membrane protein assembly factor BamB